ncbi:hypothetical protein Aduo_000881 [Ancylostoma duodenale]
MFNFAVQQFTQQFYAANLLLAQETEQLHCHHNALPALQSLLQLPHELIRYHYRRFRLRPCKHPHQWSRNLQEQLHNLCDCFAKKKR